MEKDEFKKKRERLGITQSELAEILGMSVSAISKYEMGKNEVPLYFEIIFEALEARKIKELQS